MIDGGHARLCLGDLGIARLAETGPGQTRRDSTANVTWHTGVHQYRFLACQYRFQNRFTA